jgi:hypothetical protein
MSGNWWNFQCCLGGAVIQVVVDVSLGVEDEAEVEVEVEAAPTECQACAIGRSCEQ